MSEAAIGKNHQESALPATASATNEGIGIMAVAVTADRDSGVDESTNGKEKIDPKKATNGAGKETDKKPNIKAIPSDEKRSERKKLAERKKKAEAEVKRHGEKKLLQMLRADSEVEITFEAFYAGLEKLELHLGKTDVEEVATPPSAPGESTLSTLLKELGKDGVKSKAQSMFNEWLDPKFTQDIQTTFSMKRFGPAESYSVKADGKPEAILRPNRLLKLGGEEIIIDVLARFERVRLTPDDLRGKEHPPAAFKITFVIKNQGI